jgi:nucleotide-binding universal stress UspA family protein
MEMEMYKNLLICLDNSDAANRAADLGISIAASTGARLTGCHVYAARLHNERFRQMEAGLPERYQVPGEIERQREVHDTLITKGLEIISDSYLSVLHAKASGVGLEPKGVSREGKNYFEIVAEAEEGGYDLVLMGATGLGETARGRTGSVAERVARRVRTDLLITREAEADGDGGIVVAIDGSPRSYGALKAAMGMSKTLNRPVEAISAFDTDFHYTAFRSIAGVLTEEAARMVKFSEQETLHEEIIDHGLERIYNGYLDTAKRIAAGMGEEISTKLLEGKGTDEVIKYVSDRKAALLVAGRTGAHASGGLDIGSVAENCLREASVDLLLVAGEYAADEETASVDKPAWSDEARKVLARVPGFARPMAALMVEEAARNEGIGEITVEFMQLVRKRMGF